MSKSKSIAETPLMRQYFEAKERYPEAILLFRVGDFYETFSEDAIIASKVLGIVLTKRANGPGSHVELAGFPHHSIDVYLPKLVRAGYKVAVCDQLEDPKLTKKLVKRGVTELVTPGVSYNDNLLVQKENNYLASFYINKENCGIAFLDISTGAFSVAEGTIDYADILFSNLAPKEILVQRGSERSFKETFRTNAYISSIDDWAFTYESAYKRLCNQFSINSLKGFGVENDQLAVTAAGAILSYLELTHHNALTNICSISRIERDTFVWMDKFTVRNLEIFSSLAPAEGVSLLDVIDKCTSPMGSRLLKKWLAMPLMDIDELNIRHDVVDFFVQHNEERDEIRELIGSIGDMERIVSRAAAGRISPRELVQLRRGLDKVEPIKSIATKGNSIALNQVAARLNDPLALRQLLENTLSQDPAVAVGKGDVIAQGVDAQLDDLRNIVLHGKDILSQIQKEESERTGIPSLKISYNNVFGYYIEVRNTHKDKVPSNWIRKQTLVSAERYITEELKNYEEQIVGAQDKIYVLESSILASLVQKVQEQVGVILDNAKTIAQLDVLSNFAEVAVLNNYSRPKLNKEGKLAIVQGRHPVIEQMMNPGEEYVANDLTLNSSDQQIIILTGPNMSGKSALLRQTALIVLMAQIGSFVPAKSANIGVVDKIFTRVGASDNISKGESTFMVEMYETATILHNLSKNSLVLLDEIGRGTSTYDGMSIAWSIVEYLHNSPYRPKTLFATHYHELNELEKELNRVHNFHITTQEVDGKILFLRKLCRGGVAHSFGIHVARLAGMPKSVVDNAESILQDLQSKDDQQKNNPAIPRKRHANNISQLAEEAPKSMDKGVQLSIYQLDDPLLVDIRDELKNLDINRLSPLDAFDKLRELKKKLGI